MSTVVWSRWTTSCVVPYESFRGKKERVLDTFLRRRSERERLGRVRGWTFRAIASRKGQRWNQGRVLTVLHNCASVEGKGLNLKGDKSALVIAADRLEQTGMRSATGAIGRAESGEEPGTNHDILDATPGHECVHLRRTGMVAVGFGGRGSENNCRRGGINAGCR